MEKYTPEKSQNVSAIVLGIASVLVFGLIIIFATQWSGDVKDLGNNFPSGNSQLALASAPSLSTLTSFSVLAALSAASANNTTTTGDLGLSPGLAVSRTGPWTVGGTEYFGPLSLAGNAQTDALTAFNNLAAQTPDGLWASISPTPGVYNIAADQTFTGTLTLNGNYNDVWVFQIGNDMTFSGSVVMAGNAQPCNVFWQIGRDVTIASGSSFVGTIIASRDVSLVSGATVNGRVVSLNGALTTDGNAISGPSCASAPVLPTLHVIKLVVNNGTSGTAVASDFNISVKPMGSTTNVTGSPALGVAAPGTSYSLAAGSYVVSEDANTSYTKSYSGDCDSEGNVTIVATDKICTIINTNIPPPTSISSGGGGGGSGIVPLIGILKVPSPLALPVGTGLVTYNYTVWNVGKQRALTDITLVDDKCSTITFLSGDINNDKKLGPTEEWKYSCNRTLSTTTTNTAVATGYSDDVFRFPAIATAVATVVVGVPVPLLPNTGILPPLINITKVPSRLTPFAFGGGNVTYTYNVRNPGPVSLHDVSVTDDKCSQVSSPFGDSNVNSLLDPGEVWIYTCQVYVQTSTRNVATAIGEANGFTAVGYAFATVLVAAPRLPNTGIPPQEGSSIKIPKINVSAPLGPVGLAADGSMGVPEGPNNVAWFSSGPRPGEKGTAVVAGHYGWKNNIPAVFDNLNKLKKGDKIYVEDEEGNITTFVVRTLRVYGENESSSGIFSSSDGKAHLNLITCGGIWNKNTKSYSNRLVVFADKES